MDFFSLKIRFITCIIVLIRERCAFRLNFLSCFITFSLEICSFFARLLGISSRLMADDRYITMIVVDYFFPSRFICIYSIKSLNLKNNIR